MTSAPTRKIGDREFSAISFGAMSFVAYGGAGRPDEERFKLLDRAHEIGCRHWDTANVYGESERVIGDWFKRSGKRADIFLATKIGFSKDYSLRGDTAYVNEAVEEGLRTLGVDHIDLLYLHRVDKNTPIEETVGAMAEFVKAGKVRYLGLSECTSNGLRRAHAVHPISALEVEYSPFTLDIENPKIALLKTARELGVKIVAYSPLGRGLLSGQYKSVDDFEDGDFRKGVPNYKENFSKILQVVDVLKKIGTQHNASSSQVALAWLLAQGDDIIPIPGTKTIKYLEENFAAASLKLTAEEIQDVRRAISAAGLDTAATRYPPGLMEQLFVESPPLKK